LIYLFWLPLWYLLGIVLSFVLWYIYSDYLFGIFWELCSLFLFDILILITSLVSFGHCVVCSSLIYLFWFPLWYLQAFLTHKYLQYIVVILTISSLLSMTPFWNKLHQVRPWSKDWNAFTMVFSIFFLNSCDPSIL
jgi:hypothetical protein